MKVSIVFETSKVTKKCVTNAIYLRKK